MYWEFLEKRNRKQYYCSPSLSQDASISTNCTYQTRNLNQEQPQLQAPEGNLDPLLSCSFIRGRVQSGIFNDTLRECGGSLLLGYNYENFLIYTEHHITQIGSDYSRVYRMCLVLHDNKTSPAKLNEYKP